MIFLAVANLPLPQQWQEDFSIVYEKSQSQMVAFLPTRTGKSANNLTGRELPTKPWLL